MWIRNKRYSKPSTWNNYKINHPDLDLYDDDDSSTTRRKPFLLPSNDLPLYMAHKSFNEVLLLDRMEVYNAFRRGNLILKRC